MNFGTRFPWKRETRKGGNPSASNISPRASRCYLLFQSGALACDHFWPQIHLFFLRKYFSASVRLTTTWNDRDGGEQVVKIDVKEASLHCENSRNVGTVLNKWILEIYSLIHCIYTWELKTRLSKRYCRRINLVDFIIH